MNDLKTSGNWREFDFLGLIDENHLLCKSRGILTNADMLQLLELAYARLDKNPTKEHYSLVISIEDLLDKVKTLSRLTIEFNELSLLCTQYLFSNMDVSITPEKLRYKFGTTERFNCGNDLDSIIEKLEEPSVKVGTVYPFWEEEYTDTTHIVFLIKGNVGTDGTSTIIYVSPDDIDEQTRSIHDKLLHVFSF